MCQYRGIRKIDIFDRIYTHVCAPSSSKEQYMFSLQGWFHIGGAGIIVDLYGYCW